MTANRSPSSLRSDSVRTASEPAGFGASWTCASTGRCSNFGPAPTAAGSRAGRRLVTRVRVAPLLPAGLAGFFARLGTAAGLFARPSPAFFRGVAAIESSVPTGPATSGHSHAARAEP
jgi:hypothetical protein